MKRIFVVLAFIVGVMLLLSLGGRYGSLPVAAAATSVPVFNWAKTWGGSTAGVIAKNAQVDTAGNIYVVGEFSGTVQFDPTGANPSGTITSNNGTVDAFLSKFDASGQFLWVRTWGSGPSGGNPKQGYGRDAANGLGLDAAGNSYVIGLYQSTVNFGSGIVATSNAPAGYNNIFLARFAPDGTTQWVRTWGGLIGGEGYSVAVDTVHGAVYAEGDWSTVPNTGTVDFNPAGPTHDLHANHGFYDAFLSKYDLNGNFQWARTWGGEGYDDGPGVAVDTAGNVYVGGMYGSQQINFDPAGGSAGLGHPATNTGNTVLYVDIFLSKFDASGNFQWVRTWGGLDGGGKGTVNAGEVVVTDGADSVYIVGRFGCAACNFNAGLTGNADLHSSHGDADAFISKYDVNGHFIWAKTWGGAGADQAVGAAVDRAHNVYVGGIISATVDLGGGPVTSKGLLDASLSMFATDGTFQWAQTWGGPGNDYSLGVTLDGVGSMYTFGSFQNTVDLNPSSGIDQHTATGGEDAYLSKCTNTVIVFNQHVYVPLIRR